MLKVTIRVYTGNDDDSSSHDDHDLRHIDAEKRHASHCDRPICEDDV